MLMPIVAHFYKNSTIFPNNYSYNLKCNLYAECLYKYGAPGEIRTPDLLVRSQAL